MPEVLSSHRSSGRRGHCEGTFTKRSFRRSGPAFTTECVWFPHFTTSCSLEGIVPASQRRYKRARKQKFVSAFSALERLESVVQTINRMISVSESQRVARPKIVKDGAKPTEARRQRLKKITLKARCQVQRLVKEPAGGMRPLRAYLSLPVEEYSLLDPNWIQRDATRPGAFLLTIPLQDLIGLDLQPRIRVTASVDADKGQVSLTADSFTIGDPRLDGEFDVHLHTTLSSDAASKSDIIKLPSPPVYSPTFSPASSPPSSPPSSPSSPTTSKGTGTLSNFDHRFDQSNTKAPGPIPTSSSRPALPELTATHSSFKPLQHTSASFAGTHTGPSPPLPAIQLATPPAPRGAAAASFSGLHPPTSYPLQSASLDQPITSQVPAAHSSPIPTCLSEPSSSWNESSASSSAATCLPPTSTSPKLYCVPSSHSSDLDAPVQAGPLAKICGDVTMSLSINMPQPLAIVPGPLLEYAGGTIMKLSLQGLLPGFLELLAMDYTRWAAGQAARNDATGSLLGQAHKQMGQPGASPASTGSVDFA